MDGKDGKRPDPGDAPRATSVAPGVTRRTRSPHVHRPAKSGKNPTANSIPAADDQAPPAALRRPSGTGATSPKGGTAATGTKGLGAPEEAPNQVKVLSRAATNSRGEARADQDPRARFISGSSTITLVATHAVTVFRRAPPISRLSVAPRRVDARMATVPAEDGGSAAPTIAPIRAGRGRLTRGVTFGTPGTPERRIALSLA